MSITQEIRLRARHRKETRDDLIRRIADMKQEHKAELARRDDTEHQLICALRKACGEVDTQTQALNAAVIIAAGRAEEIRSLKDKLRVQAGKVVRREAELRRLTASLKNTQQELARVRPRITCVDTQFVRPFAPVVVLPYVSPVPHQDTSSEQTQELPILDRPAAPPARGLLSLTFAHGAQKVTASGDHTPATA